MLTYGSAAAEPELSTLMEAYLLKLLRPDKFSAEEASPPLDAEIFFTAPDFLLDFLADEVLPWPIVSRTEAPLSVN